MQNLFLLLLISLILFSCGDYAALEAIDKNKRIADSLYYVQKDTIKKSYDELCDSIYGLEFDRALDSIKILRLEGIKDLIEN